MSASSISATRICAELEKRGLKWPIRIVLLSDHVAVVNDGRITRGLVRSALIGSVLPERV